jgi:hypothetical protein
MEILITKIRNASITQNWEKFSEYIDKILSSSDFNYINNDYQKVLNDTRCINEILEILNFYNTQLTQNFVTLLSLIMNKNYNDICRLGLDSTFIYEINKINNNMYRFILVYYYNQSYYNQSYYYGTYPGIYYTS